MENAQRSAWRRRRRPRRDRRMVRIAASRAGLLSLSCVKEIKSFWRVKQKTTNNHCLDLVNNIIVYLLVGAIQEQQKEIESLKAKIDNKIV